MTIDHTAVNVLNFKYIVNILKSFLNCVDNGCRENNVWVWLSVGILIDDLWMVRRAKNQSLIIPLLNLIQISHFSSNYNSSKFYLGPPVVDVFWLELNYVQSDWALEDLWTSYESRWRSSVPNCILLCKDTLFKSSGCTIKWMTHIVNKFHKNIFLPMQFSYRS